MTCRSRKADRAGSWFPGLHHPLGPPQSRGRPPGRKEESASTAEATITKAVAILLATKGSKVEGRVTFTQTENGIQVKGEISGLAPGEHGFHVHEFGVWSPDGKAAGGHFNPTAQKHGEREASKRHVGDLGNIKATSTAMP